jgi:hypothetical protein
VDLKFEQATVFNLELPLCWRTVVTLFNRPSLVFRLEMMYPASVPGQMLHKSSLPSRSYRNNSWQMPTHFCCSPLLSIILESYHAHSFLYPEPPIFVFTHSLTWNRQFCLLLPVQKREVPSWSFHQRDFGRRSWTPDTLLLIAVATPHIFTADTWIQTSKSADI